MNEKEIRAFINTYLKVKNVESLKGLTFTLNLFEDVGDRFFFPDTTPEEFVRDYCEESIAYYRDSDYDRAFFDIDELIDYLYDELSEYIDEENKHTMDKIDDSTHDKIIEYFNEHAEVLVKNHFTKKELQRRTKE